jgi:hypothetical protein
VSWTYGNLLPDLIEIRDQNSDKLYITLPVNKVTRQPTSTQFDVPAPTFLTLAVCPRIEKNNVIQEKMTDDAGQEEYWANLALALPQFAVAAAQGGGASRPPMPVITGSTLEEGMFTVNWTADGAFNFFNLRVEPGPPQFKLGKEDRSWTREHTSANADYHFYIQACSGGPVTGSVCSEFAHTLIHIPVDMGFVPWRKWIPIHREVVFSPSGATEAICRDDEHTEVFKIGYDGAVWASSQDVDHVTWTGWQRLPPVVAFDPEGSLAAASRSAEHVDVFAIGPEGTVWSTGRHGREITWTQWFQIGGQRGIEKTAKIAATCRTSTHIDLFVLDSTGVVKSTWFEDDGQGWRDWFPIDQGTTFPPEAAPVCVSRTESHVDLFVIGNDGAVWSCWWEPDQALWRRWFQIHPETVFRHDQRLTAVSRNEDHVDLFVIGHDGAVWSTYWHSDQNDWRPWFQIQSGRRFAPEAKVSAVARGVNDVSVFVKDETGTVWTTAWSADQEWTEWMAVRPPTKFEANHPLAAVSRETESITLLDTARDGVVLSSWWSL